MKRKGFTLIELLIAMAILGILATVGLGSFRSSQIKGRDAQRKSDLSNLQKGLELYMNDYNVYPDNLPAGGGAWEDANGTLYIREVPQDPKGVDYCYEAEATGAWYKIYAKLENEQDPGIEKTCGTDGADCSCGGDSDYNFKLESPNAE